MTVVSEHKDRVVREKGDRFYKEFATRRARDAELKRLRALEALGVAVPRIVSTEGALLVTERLPGRPLDEVIRRDWASMSRADRGALIARVAAVCRRIADGGYDWPDLVTYHLFVDDETVSVLDPARLRRGRLDLSALFWSTEEPTVSRADRLRFWRAFAGDAPPPRLRRIGHRGRFRPYRWAIQRTDIRPCPPWADFVNPAGAPFASADEAAASPRLKVKRTLKDRTNAVLDAWVVKITADPDEARREWENHRLMMAAGFRVPRPAFGGVLEDGRGLFATGRLEGQFPLDDLWARVDRRRLVRAVADLARRLHACGLVHRDLYLCHLFAAPGDDALTLIDLARLEKTTSKRRRVKDLAALVHSARGLWSRTDLLRALRRYGGDRKLAAAVLSKAARMGRHVPRNVRDGTHVRHVPRGA